MRVKNNKNRKINKLRQNKGVTLIALVITILVLLIISSITIKGVFSKDGFLKKSQEVQNKATNDLKTDEEELNHVIKEFGNEIADVPPELIGPEMPSDWDSGKVTVIDDGNGNPVPLPKDFYYVGGDIKTGIVISDIEGDTMDASYPNSGNQFVWIPVESEADLIRTNFDETTGKPIAGLSADYVEPYTRGYSDGNGTEEAQEYNTMKKQVLKYGGFYIGRFEAGLNSTQINVSSPPSGAAAAAKTVVCKKGVSPYNWATWGISMSDIGNEKTSTATYLSKNFASQEGYTSVTSTLIYGCQWDAMCRYLGADSAKTAPKKNTTELTGSVSTDKYKNIYDLAGNCAEWTMEANNFMGYRYCRGGSIYSSPISSRAMNPTGGLSGSRSFRIALYIK